MKRVSLFCAVAAAAAMMVPSAKADLFTISFNGGPVGYSGTGVFNAVNDGGGVYTVEQVLSGSVTDPFFGTSSITGISTTYDGPDNLLDFPSTTYFDYNGLSFTLANGVSINLFSSGGLDGAAQSNPNGDIDELVTDTVTPAATPEPSSFVLLGTAALLGMGDVVRRRRSIA